jgi:glyoxylate/hydroxypyruvate reductase A
VQSRREPAIAIHVEGEEPGPWLDAFRQAFPSWQVLAGAEIVPSVVEQVVVAVVWAPPPGFLGRFPNLKRIVSVGTGIDHLSSDPSRSPHVPVIPRQDPASIRAMAEFVLMQVLLHHRRIGDSILDRSARLWRPEIRGPLAGCRISLLGYGPMGQAAAKLLLQFGCDVTAWSRTAKPQAAGKMRSGWSELDAMFPQADLLINLLPSTEETRGLIDDRRLGMLPRGAGFINVGRGDVVEQATLLSRLDAGHLSLASLDVLPSEPPAADDPIWTHPRVILTPHVASLPIPALFAAWVASTALH